MGKGNWLEAVANQTQIGKVLATNQYTEKYGLALSEEDAQIIALIAVLQREMEK